MNKNELERNLDKLVETDVDEAIEKKHEYNYDEEVANVEGPCCSECQGQAAYFLKG